MKIALVQMHSAKGNMGENLETMKRFFEKLSQEHVDMIAFPEMNLTGYFDIVAYQDKALRLTDKAVVDAIRLTAGNDVTLLFGIAEEMNGKLYISQIVAESGEIVGVYRKHNIINNEADVFAAGDGEPMFTKGDMKYGLTICADIDLPDLYQRYASKECDIVFECASPNLYGDRETRNWEKGYQWWRNNCIEKLGKYARDNAMQIAVATQGGRNAEDDFPGGGYLFSSTGELISETKDYKQDILVINI